MSDKYFQQVSITLKLNKEISGGTLNRVIKSYGAKLSYNVYAFERLDSFPNWQSECFAYVKLEKSGNEVDAQEGCDSIILNYPMATIDSSNISVFSNLVIDLSKALDAEVFSDLGLIESKISLVDYLDSVSSKLMSETGEEPGSEILRMMIEGVI